MRFLDLDWRTLQILPDGMQVGISCSPTSPQDAAAYLPELT